MPNPKTATDLAINSATKPNPNTATNRTAKPLSKTIAYKGWKMPAPGGRGVFYGYTRAPIEGKNGQYAAVVLTHEPRSNGGGFCRAVQRARLCKTQGQAALIAHDWLTRKAQSAQSRKPYPVLVYAHFSEPKASWDKHAT